MREEDKIAAELVRWAKDRLLVYPCLTLFHHIPNEGKRAPWRAGRERILAGIPDYHLPVPSRGYYGLYIELKSKGKTPTKAQRAVIEQLQHYGNKVVVCDNIDDAIRVLESYCKGVKDRKWAVTAFESNKEWDGEK